MNSLNISDGVALDTGYNGKGIGDERAHTQAASRTGAYRSPYQCSHRCGVAQLRRAPLVWGDGGGQGSLPGLSHTVG